MELGYENSFHYVVVDLYGERWRIATFNSTFLFGKLFHSLEEAALAANSRNQTDGVLTHGYVLARSEPSTFQILDITTNKIVVADIQGMKNALPIYNDLIQSRATELGIKTIIQNAPTSFHVRKRNEDKWEIILTNKGEEVILSVYTNKKLAEECCIGYMRRYEYANGITGQRKPNAPETEQESETTSIEAENPIYGIF